MNFIIKNVFYAYLNIHTYIHNVYVYMYMSMSKIHPYAKLYIYKYINTNINIYILIFTFVIYVVYYIYIYIYIYNMILLTKVTIYDIIFRMIISSFDVYLIIMPLCIVVHISAYTLFVSLTLTHLSMHYMETNLRFTSLLAITLLYIEQYVSIISKERDIDNSFTFNSRAIK